ncbi:augmin complex subunit dgt4 [Anastrepha ludens]|uniref:augmin complex subunit dgt4 n=1 Tax=Anastrepha ludens TaxID=28586 RepID=UPI0023AF3551|nr:augmin complex subunit dgt4 [Anastrepha ludens]
MSGTSATPTSASSAASVSPSADNTGMEDIQYLLYLETLRRFRDDETNIKRQVDEKTRQYLEVKENYLQLYAKYVKLTTLAATRCALLTDNPLPIATVTAANNEIDAAARKLASGDMMEPINEVDVVQCRDKLSACKTHEKLKQLKRELAESKTTVRAIQTSAETVDATIETATLQSLDNFVGEVGENRLKKTPLRNLFTNK